MQNFQRRIRRGKRLDRHISQQILPLFLKIIEIQPAYPIGDLLAVGRVAGHLDVRPQNPAFISELPDQLWVLVQKKLIVTVVAVQTGNPAVHWLAALAVEHAGCVGTSGEGQSDVRRLTGAALALPKSVINALGQRSLVE